MSLSPSPSPPPFPSPQLLPIPLLSPPRRLLDHPRSHDALHRAPRFPDSTPRAEHKRSLHSRTLKRTLSQSSFRCRSPPPSPAIRTPPPPVPPIPAFVLAINHSSARPSIPNPTPTFDLYLDRPKDASFCESQARGPLTCMQFLAVHNSRQQLECRV
ncbi:hypothetical protein JVU11DRAFT_1631 [Chiua virens]|nr:hypothetical protein JVU11DRAFT_1631 [Chiua virens]